MPDEILASRSAGEGADVRKPFLPPAVEDLGRLQALTQLLQGTIPVEP